MERVEREKIFRREKSDAGGGSYPVCASGSGADGGCGRRKTCEEVAGAGWVGVALAGARVPELGLIGWRRRGGEAREADLVCERIRADSARLYCGGNKAARRN